MNSIRKIFLSSRPISWVNSAYPFVATYLVINQEANDILIIGGLYFLFPYNLLMYGINDVFDFESDQNNPRKGNLEGALVEKPYHRALILSAVFINAPFILYLAWVGSLFSNLTLAYLIFMVVAYSAPRLRFKEVPFLDSLTSSSHFVGPMLFAISLFGWENEYAIVLIAFFLWGMASHAFGSVQDIIPDRKGNIDSIATKLGAQFTVRFSFVLYCLSSLILLASMKPYSVIGLASLMYALSIYPYMSLRDSQSMKAHGGWVRFLWLNQITGFLITVIILLYFLDS